MLVVLNDEIFNMGKFDSIKCKDKVGIYPYRIAFFRKNINILLIVKKSMCMLPICQS